MIFGLRCAAHTKRLLNSLFKYCCCFHQHGCVSRRFQCCRELNENLITAKTPERDLRCAVANFSPRINGLVAKKQAHPSH